MTKVLAGFLLIVLFFSNYSFALNSKLAEFTPKYIARYFSGPKGDIPAAYVIGTFPGDDELMVIRSEEGSLLLMGFKTPISELKPGKSFWTPDLQVHDKDQWTPDDNYFGFSIGGSDGYLTFRHGDANYSLTPTNANWMTNFGNIEFKNECPSTVAAKKSDSGEIAPKVD
jgi:hypothetical protein